MGSPSISTHRGLVHWQGLLLLVSFLIFWSPNTTAEISVVAPYALEGKDVLLRIHNKPPDASGVEWYKWNGFDSNYIIAFSIMTSGEYVSGPGYKGAEMITDDGSLLLKNVTVKDTGMYTVVVHLPDSKTETAFGRLDVFEYLRVPVLLASRYRVRRNKDDLVLTCNTSALAIQWLFNGTDLQLTDRMKLSGNDRRLTINPVKKEDGGVYKCKAWNPFMWVESRPLKLCVL